MIRRAWLTTVMLSALILAAPAHATLLTGTSQPARTQANATTSTTISITWRITTDAGHINGASSIGGDFMDALTGARIDAVLVPLGAPTGGGTLIFNELLTLTPAQVASFLQQGVRVLGYRRVFTAAGSPPVTVQVAVSLQSGGLASSREITTGELVVQRMELSFPSGRPIEVVARDASLQAQLQIAYTGGGTLRGRWEIADPGTDGQPFFRVLALVREYLGGAQRVTLRSPALPTLIAGRYALRFCVDAADSRAEPCAATDTAVQTLYEVTADNAPHELRGLTPDAQRVSKGAAFRWPAVSGVTTWQLQVFTPGAPQPDGSTEEPRFVSGMLLPGATDQSTLSTLVRRKLASGQRYLWRVTAHDREGRLLAASEFASFTWQP